MASFVFLLLASVPLLLGCYGCVEGDLRLADGPRNSSGRVEFCHGGEWGTVCDDGFGSNEARVVCRQLGLPTNVALTMSVFGGGSGAILLDDVECSGLEERLENCSHNEIGVHDCGHHEDVGVVCDLGQGNGKRCRHEDRELELTREELEWFGNCVPYKIRERGNPCDLLYTAEVDHVYIPNRRTGGDIDSYLDLVEDAGLIINVVPDKCHDPALLVLCHFYFPPCGNATIFEPPTSVCIDACKYLQQLCPFEYEQVLGYFEENDFWLRPKGLTFINCSNTGEYLDPLPYCCSDAGVEIPCTKLNDSGELVPDPACLRSPAALPSPSTIVLPGLSHQNSEDLATTVGSVCASVVVLLLVVVSAIMCILIKKHRQNMKKNISDSWSPRRLRSLQGQEMSGRYCVDGNLLQPPPVVPPRAVRIPSGYIRQLNEEKLLIPGKNIHLQNCVGQGEFGIVYRGTLSGWRVKGQELIAVKTLKGIFTINELNNMVEESLKMSKFHHPNVMRLIGVCIDGGETPYIVMPFMIYGSLLSYLKKHRAELTIAISDNTDLVTTAQKKLFSMCIQIAKGMSYLADRKFVHRDLAARNCMIDNNFVIKVSDFGLSEDVYARNYFRQGKLGEADGNQVKLPVRWMALESLNDGVFTEKTDVWSFGVTCWEVFSLGKSPYPGVDPFTLIKYLERGERLEKPVNEACSQEIYDIMKECWKEIPDKRPNFSDLVTTISTILERIAGYLDFTATPLTPAENAGSGYDHLVVKITSVNDNNQEQVHSLD